MIIVHNKKVKVYTYFDKNTQENAETYKLVCVNKTTNEEYTWDDLQNISTMADYYEFRFSFSGVTDGEYEYELSFEENSKKKIVDKGILVVGEYAGLEKAEYTTTKRYECYDPLNKKD